MDHEVKDHVHVQAARAEDAQPVDFEKKRAARYRSSCQHAGIEALHVPDLENPLVRGGELDQFVSLSDVPGDRFLDQRVYAALERPPRHGRVLAGRYHDAHRLDRGQSLVQAFKSSHSEFARRLPAPLRARVINPDEFRARDFLEGASVVPAVLSDPDDGDARPFVWLGHCT